MNPAAQEVKNVTWSSFEAPLREYSVHLRHKLEENMFVPASCFALTFACFTFYSKRMPTQFDNNEIKYTHDKIILYANINNLYKKHVYFFYFKLFSLTPVIFFLPKQRTAEQVVIPRLVRAFKNLED